MSVIYMSLKSALMCDSLFKMWFLGTKVANEEILNLNFSSYIIIITERAMPQML